MFPWRSTATARQPDLTVMLAMSLPDQISIILQSFHVCLTCQEPPALTDRHQLPNLLNKEFHPDQLYRGTTNYTLYYCCFISTDQIVNLFLNTS